MIRLIDNVKSARVDWCARNVENVIWYIKGVATSAGDELIWRIRAETKQHQLYGFKIGAYQQKYRGRSAIRNNDVLLLGYINGRGGKCVRRLDHTLNGILHTEVIEKSEKAEEQANDHHDNELSHRLCQRISICLKD
ncbi:hypothetical protein NPIL_298591 [Nephila pilipes]|uniref:Uncharacterized protein n=1 Tax=Nephila pilipes TaxID=299642 RepID=A0A8X6US17_NEPPI|nr:hypothetical protein NPIL_298591 [Nephila pilipes]